ncbi:glycerophosphodiester phosphodiesterase 1-like isoform X2 [Symsagittifera roscoffensis]|uniref:glycerophosphodiester phosphodiesterase 1-like isoform X2 n=1 Tax=Symsagittifera roscoffensis TaxID=84072 RepID=UPI00307BCEFD
MIELEFFHIIAGAVVLALPAITLAVSHQVRKRSCKRRSSSKSSMLFNSKGKKCEMIAHKGAALDGPENTIGAIHKAASNGFDGVEIDIQLTSDKVAVLFHDDTVDRTTDGTGNVRDFTLQQISQLNAAAKFDGDWPNSETVPVLADAVDVAISHDLFVFFDIKDTHQQTLKQLLDQFKRYPQLYSRSVICAFDFRFLYKVKRIDPNIAVVPIYSKFSCHALEGCSSLSFLLWLLPWTVVQICLYILFYYVNPLCLDHDVVSVDHRLISDGFLRWADQWRKEVVVWTVNDDQKKFEFIKHKRLSVITDSHSIRTN